MERILQTKRIVQHLQKHAEWLYDQRGKEVRPNGTNRARMIVNGCAALLSQSPASYGGWLCRRDRRDLIKTGPAKYSKPKHNRALRDLVALTISDLEACELFRPEVWCRLDLVGEETPADPTTVCETCGREFEPVRSTAKFCSDRCRYKARSLRKNGAHANSPKSKKGIKGRRPRKSGLSVHG